MQTDFGKLTLASAADASRSAGEEMKLTERFRRLSLWNKIGVIGALASILGIVISIITSQHSSPLPSEHSFQSNVNGNGINIQIGESKGNVTVIQRAEKINLPLENKNISSDLQNNRSDAPIFTFTDGISARVSMSLVMQVDIEKAAHVIAVFGEQDIARKKLADAVEGKAYAELEKHPLEWVRSHRKTVADSIIEACKEDMTRTFHNILSLEIKEITVVQR